MREAEALAEIAPGAHRWIRRQVQHRIEQQLPRRLRSALITQAQAGDDGQAAARAVPSQHEALRIHPEFARMRDQPACRRQAVLGCSRELVFRRQPVIDRCDGAPRPSAQAAADCKMKSCSVYYKNLQLPKKR